MTGLFGAWKLKASNWDIIELHIGTEIAKYQFISPDIDVSFSFWAKRAHRQNKPEIESPEKKRSHTIKNKNGEEQ